MQTRKLDRNPNAAKNKLALGGKFDRRLNANYAQSNNRRVRPDENPYAMTVTYLPESERVSKPATSWQSEYYGETYVGYKPEPIMRFGRLAKS